MSDDTLLFTLTVENGGVPHLRSFTQTGTPVDDLDLALLFDGEDPETYLRDREINEHRCTLVFGGMSFTIFLARYKLEDDDEQDDPRVEISVFGILTDDSGRQIVQTRCLFAGMYGDSDSWEGPFPEGRRKGRSYPVASTPVRVSLATVYKDGKLYPALIGVNSAEQQEMMPITRRDEHGGITLSRDKPWTTVEFLGRTYDIEWEFGIHRVLIKVRGRLVRSLATKHMNRTTNLGMCEMSFSGACSTWLIGTLMHQTRQRGRPAPAAK